MSDKHEASEDARRGASWEEARRANLLRFADATPEQKLNWLTSMREMLRQRRTAPLESIDTESAIEP